MKLRSLAIVLGFILSAAEDGSANAAAPPEKQKPLWHTDYKYARAIARREGKPLLVVFR
jgi:hypothetical protein